MKRSLIIKTASSVLAVCLIAVGIYAAPAVRNEIIKNVSGQSLADGEETVSSEVTSSDTASEEELDYDISVTTFNVGNFYLGTQTGINPGAYGEENAQKALDAWDEDIPKYASLCDIYGLQECGPIYYWDDTTTISTEEKFVGEGKPFKQLDIHQSKTHYGTLDLCCALATAGESEYELYDITHGYISNSSDSMRRGYVKGYVDINDKKVAVFSVHLFFARDWDTQLSKEAQQEIVTNSYYELIDLINKEDYAIVMGDMNASAPITTVMKAAGFNMANMGEFGNMHSNIYGENKFIDNVFTTPNIDIVSAELMPDNNGSSDHIPILAKLKITGDENWERSTVSTDDEGFVASHY